MRHPFRILSAPEPPAETPEGEALEQSLQRQRADAAEAAQAAEAEERAQLRKNAAQEGYEEGLRRGRAEALEAIKGAIGPAVERLQAATERHDRECDAVRAAMARAAITLGQTLAETLVGVPRPFDRESLLAGMLEEAREEGVQEATLVCRAAPKTLAEIGQAFPDALTMREDREMRPGGFVIELNDDGATINRWDASIERMERVIRELNSDV
ncbi:hypothetical protein [uncultured Thioclava sp.]|mgnify:CR=1 FL=1|uniref:FliH/SctL family protein n=1 Tax=uncultured Thioclava sp. TaxID=473858 RepID=UPI0025EFF2BC|nr:hypothetical protein [uncultured Thioclava sp.]